MNCYFMEKQFILVLINVINYCFDFISYFITPLNYDKKLPLIAYENDISGSGCQCCGNN